MSTYTITAQDGTDDATTPILIDGFATDAESGNIIHDLIDGSVAVTLVGDRLRTGTLNLVYNDDTAADEACLLLGRKTSYQLDVPDRPALSLLFVRAGTISPALHDSVRSLWTVAVGFQEVEA